MRVRQNHQSRAQNSLPAISPGEMSGNILSTQRAAELPILRPHITRVRAAKNDGGLRSQAAAEELVYSFKKSPAAHQPHSLGSWTKQAADLFATNVRASRCRESSECDSRDDIENKACCSVGSLTM